MLARPQIVPVIPRNYRLRWHLQFVDRPAKIGKWNNVGAPEGELAMIGKSGLARFLVEAEHIETFATVVLIDVHGQDYAFAQWAMHVRSPSIGLSGAVHLKTPAVNGLSIWTNDEKITAFIDGSVTRRPLTEAERRFDFLEHRAGT